MYRPRLYIVTASWMLMGLALASQPARAQSAESALDFEFFRTKVQPIFLYKRPHHARCIGCHVVPPGGRTPAMAPLPKGSLMWNEADSRKNFEEFSRVAIPGNIKSPLLVHPLAQAAGGDVAHLGGKHFTSQDDPEWKVLKAWVFGAKVPAGPVVNKPRILQTNFAGDTVDVIDPATNKVVGTIEGIELNHGATASPDGAWIYVSNEHESSLDVVESKSLLLMYRIPLSGHPNNISIGRDGTRVYVSITGVPGAVDVIDTTLRTVIKTVPTKMATHNTYVTPDGKFAVAGSIAGKDITVIDTATNEVAWVLTMDLGIRPMAILANPDGSTKWVIMQLTAFNGFAVVDFATHKEINRVKLPDLPADRKPYPPGAEISHGMAITPDRTTLLVVSRINSAVYSYSLPDLKLQGTAFLEGKGSGWMSIETSGKTAYISNVVTDDVSAVDIKSMKEIARIPVGASPKRNAAVMIP